VKKYLILLITVFVFISCSKKQEMTTSKIKIFGSSAFSAGGPLATKASNGLFFYGKSKDGKSFITKIDSDSVDLAFPNGTWDFFAVAWDNTAGSSTVASLFVGKTYCGKTLGVNLNGTDTSIAMNLSNVGCSDAAFTTAPLPLPSVTAVGGMETRLPRKTIYGCRDISMVTNELGYQNCTRAKNNKGFATFAKIFIPQYKNFGNGLEAYDDSQKSACIAMEPGAAYSRNAITAAGYLDLLQVHLPDAINGLDIKLKLYYGEAPCDETAGVDELIIPPTDTPRTKTFISASGAIEKESVLIYQSNEAQVCYAKGASVNDFAGGLGTPDFPYIICNENQFNIISTYFTSKNYAAKSFELASDLDFLFGPFNPIGDPLTEANKMAGTAFNGSFYGNNHTIRNILLKNSNNITSNGTHLGLIRMANGVTPTTEIRDLTVNKFAVMGFEAFNYVGILVGQAVDVSLRNIKVFGHLEGSSLIGGITGSLLSSSANVEIANSHAEVDINYKLDLGNFNGAIGGIAGEVISPASTQANLKNISFRGKITKNGNTNEKFLEVPVEIYNAVTVGMGITNMAGGTNSIGQISSLKSKTDNSNVTTYWIGLNNTNYALMYYSTSIYPLNGTINDIEIGGVGVTTGAPIYAAGIGGIVGNMNSSTLSSNANILNATVKAEKIEGDIVVGGLAGNIGKIKVSNAFVEANIKSDPWADANVNNGGGGVIGQAIDSSVSNTISAGVRSYSLGLNGGGGTFGIIGGATTSTANYYVGTSTNASDLGIKMALDATSANTMKGAYLKANYPSTMFYKLSGAGAPLVASTASGDMYYDYVADSCYTYTISVSSFWTQIPCPEYSGWVMNADGFNFPRLASELHSEATVPYLKRNCTKAIDFVPGTTATDGGKIICTLGQLTAKTNATDPADHLGQNIYYSSATLLSAPLYAAGIYKLNGENNSIIEFKTSGEGLFAALNVGSDISNLNILNSSFDLTSRTGVGNNIGTLAGLNAGKITNVNIRETNINFNFNTSPLSSTNTYFVGGLVGINNGSIFNSQIGTEISIMGPRIMNARLYIGGVTGSSIGTMTGLRVFGVINRNSFNSDLMDSTALTSMASGIAEIMGSISGYVSGGIISEVKTDNSISFNPSGTNFKVYAAPAYGESSTASPVTLRDFYLNSHLNLNNNAVVQNNFNIIQKAGTLNRGIFEFGDVDSANRITDFTGYTAADTSANVLYYYNGRGVGTPSNNNIVKGIVFYNTASGITYGTGANSIAMTGWNFGTDFVNSIKNGNVWSIDFRGFTETTNMPNLVKTDGNFDEIGKGF
jgi:hypothetical protein